MHTDYVNITYSRYSPQHTTTILESFNVRALFMHTDYVNITYSVV